MLDGRYHVAARPRHVPRGAGAGGCAIRRRVATTPPPFSPFDATPWLAMMSRVLQGPEQALRVYRELLGLESGSRERAVDLMAQMAQGVGVDATPFFEGVLRFAPAPTARIAAAAYLAERGHEDTVVEVLEGLGSPV